MPGSRLRRKPGCFAFSEAHYCSNEYVYCGVPVRNIGINHIVSHPGRLYYIGAKSHLHPIVFPLRGRHLEAHLQYADTFFAVARPVGAGKTVTAERINPFFQRRINADADTVFASARPETADKTVTSGTASLFPTRVRRKTQLRTNVAREFYGLVSNFDTGPPEISVSAAASNRF